MIIRQAAKEDIPELERILYQVHDVHACGRPDLFMKGQKKYSGEELEQIIEKDEAVIFVCEDEGAVCGYVFCFDRTFPGNASMYPDKMLYIDDLCVDEKCRGKNIGRALCEHVKEYASECGYDRITLNVWEINPGARSFYDALGFSPLKTTMEMKL